MKFFKNNFILKKINFIIFEDFLKKFNNLFLFLIFFLFILLIFFFILILTPDIYDGFYFIGDDLHILDMDYYITCIFSAFFFLDYEILFFLEFLININEDLDLELLDLIKFEFLDSIKFELLNKDLNIPFLSIYKIIYIKKDSDLNVVNDISGYICLVFFFIRFFFKILMYVLLIHIFSYFDNFIYDYFKELNIFKNIMKLLFFFIIIFLDYIIILI